MTVCGWCAAPTRGLLGGMAALPGTDWTVKQDRPTAAMGAVHHVFTHFSLDLDIAVAAAPIGDGWWQPIGELDAPGCRPCTVGQSSVMLTQERRSAA